MAAGLNKSKEVPPDETAVVSEIATATAVAGLRSAPDAI